MKLLALQAIALLLAAAGVTRTAVAVMPTALYIMNVDGSDVRKLIEVDDFTYLRAPRWSRDGQHVVFSGYPKAPGGLRTCFVVKIDGTGLREMGRGDLPDWSPDGKQLVYQERASGTMPGVSVQNLDGQGATHVTEGLSPRWSPDGRQLATASADNVHLLDLLTGEQRTLLGTKVYGVFSGFDWSPDGKHLAVVVRPQKEGRRELLLLEADKENQQPQARLRNEMGGMVSFSPDGKRLTFADGYKIYVLDVDSQQRPQLIPGQRGRNLHPAFSPDGRQIVFASDRDAPAP